jgi:hypothetical protein
MRRSTDGLLVAASWRWIFLINACIQPTLFAAADAGRRYPWYGCGGISGSSHGRASAIGRTRAA